MVTYTVETNTQNKAIKTIFLNYLWLHAARTVSSFNLGQTGPGWSLILIVYSCQLSKPTEAQVSFGVGIFRCENAVFSQSVERVSKSPLERVPTAFQPRSNRVTTALRPRFDRVPTAIGTRYFWAVLYVRWSTAGTRKSFTITAVWPDFLSGYYQTSCWNFTKFDIFFTKHVQIPRFEISGCVQSL
jgi:hypothetical protein